MRRQRGFALLELAVAALIATLLVVWGADSLARRLDEARAQALAAWMLAVRSGVQVFLRRHAAVLVSTGDTGALASQGIANWHQPLLPELKAAGFLSPGFPERGPGGMRVAIRLLPAPQCPGDGCAVQALIHGTAALLDRRLERVDERLTALWLLASAGLGGTVDRREPSVIRGAAFGFPNPPAFGMPALAVGTPAVAVTAGQAGDAQFLRVGDDRDPDFQAAASIKGDVRTEGSVVAREYLVTGARHAARSFCAQEGAVSRDAYRGLLVCQNGAWRSAGGRGGGGFSTNSLYGCAASGGMSTANPVTGSCTCPPGYAIVAISDSGVAAAPDGRTRGYLCVE